MARIDFQIINAQFVTTRRSTTQKRTHAGEQFREREWFHHVIIRAEFKSFYAIAHAITGCQKNDRRLRLGRAQFFNESPAIFFRQHDIDNEQVKPARTRCGQPGLAIEGEIDGETGFAQTLCQKSRRLLFIFDHQNSHTPDNLLLIFAPVLALISVLVSKSKRMGRTRERKTYETALSRPGGRAITSPASRNVVAAENRQ